VTILIGVSDDTKVSPHTTTTILSFYINHKS